MNASPVAALIRGWVDLYTRGMPAAVRAARRDEVDDDLWCQQQEALVAGRSAQSLGGELLLRLVFGIPADISWRVSNRVSAEARALERSASMSARVIGALAILAAASWGVAAAVVVVAGNDAWTEPLVQVLGLGGSVAFAATGIALAWRFQDELSSFGALGGVIGGVGMFLGSFGAYPLFLLFPFGSAVLAWDLGRVGIVPRGLSILHAVSAAALLALFVAVLADYEATYDNPMLIALVAPFLVSWVATGVSLLRGVPQAHEPARGA
jgi:hypothetical protein